MARDISCKPIPVNRVRVQQLLVLVAKLFANIVKILVALVPEDPEKNCRAGQKDRRDQVTAAQARRIAGIRLTVVLMPLSAASVCSWLPATYPKAAMIRTPKADPIALPSFVDRP